MFNSKYKFAKIIAEKLGYDSDLVFEKALEGGEFMAKRPENTSLNNHLFKKLIKDEPQNLEIWLEKMKNEFNSLTNNSNSSLNSFI